MSALRRLAPCLMVMALGLLPAGTARAAAGDLDPTFGTGGRTVLPGASATASALAPDGGLLLAGVSALGPRSAAVGRLAPSGAPDTAFGVGGLQFYDLGGTDDIATAIASLPDGRIVVAGSRFEAATDTSEFAALRLRADGSVDSTFAGTGIQDFPGSNAGLAGAVAPDGSIVVAGSSAGTGITDFAVARFTASGEPDTGFGTGGKSQLDFAGGLDEARAVALAPDGRIVVAGDTGAGLGGVRDMAVLRLTAGGLGDAGFGVLGRSRVDFGATASGEAIALAPDGRIVVAGTAAGDLAVARLNPGGYFDTTFGAGGRSLVDFGGNDRGAAVAVAASGKIIVAGRSGGDFAVARLQPNGAPDTTFGPGGRVRIDFGAEDAAESVVLARDGRVIVAGGSGAAFAVARLQGDGPGPGGPAGAGASPGGRFRAPTCAGRRATIVGTRAPDRLRGSRRRDVIAGLGGADTIRGLGGADIICGGSGADRLLGGPGADALRGEAGSDRLLGGAGPDRLLGGAGRDRLSGGLGRDLLIGGTGRDVERP